MDRGAWRASVHRVSKNWTQLSDFDHARTQEGQQLEEGGLSGGGQAWVQEGSATQVCCRQAEALG